MTQRIGRARYAAEMSKNELQLQHNYLETVMGALTTGVIALDKTWQDHYCKLGSRDDFRLALK
jgi:nitrogen fixation/metabolism regulation signal transduction histidine kinase